MRRKKDSSSPDNWQEYQRLMKSGQLNDSIGDYGGFVNGKYIGSETTKKELDKKILAKTELEGRLYITMIGLEFEDVVKKEMLGLLGDMIEITETGNEKGELKKLNKSYGKMERVLKNDPSAVPDPEYYQCRQLIMEASRNRKNREGLISEAKSMISGIAEKENVTQ